MKRAQHVLVVVFMLVVAAWTAQVASSGNVPIPSEAPSALRPAAGWERQYAPTSRTLRAVYFIDANTGWAVGGDRTNPAVAVRTTDGGRTWQGGNLAEVMAPLPGARRNVTTIDGSLTWENGTLSINGALQGVHFVNANEGWAVGPPGLIVHTRNGGATWEQQNSDTESTLLSVFFTDALHGWVTDRIGRLHVTRDGGASWEEQELAPRSVGLFWIDFADDQRAWIVGSQGKIYYTWDGGESWGEQSSHVDTDLMSVSFVNGYEGWISGVSKILHTTDAGQSWHTQADGQVRKNLNGINFADRFHGWAVGDGGFILRTDDGGQNWYEESSGEGGNLENVDFVPGTLQGWAVGNGGLIIHWGEPVAATNTPVPPTSTPSPTATRTPTPTATPSPTATPTGPWLDWAPGPAALHLIYGQTRNVTVGFGNLQSPGTITAFLTGKAVFGDGLQVATGTLETTSGQHTFVIRPEDTAVLGDAFQLRIRVGDLEITREGKIAWGVYQPLVLRHASP